MSEKEKFLCIEHSKNVYCSLSMHLNWYYIEMVKNQE